MLKSTRVNAICPYYTMFPLEFPVATLARTQSTGWVLDPFCGRGTTNFAARLAGRPSIGVDASPVAVAITKSKQVSVRPERIVAAAKSVLASFSASEIRTPTGEFWRWAYHGTTLKQLCGLRAALLKDCRSDVRIALRAIILGALHGPLTKGPASHFSNQMPRTYAPKPRYASRFWISRRMPPIQVDVIQIIRSRATRYFAETPPRVDSQITLGDSREPNYFACLPRIDTVVTSPPYYGVRTYMTDQWLRHWFVGGPAEVDYVYPDSQLAHSGADAFALQLRSVWANVATVASKKARLIVRFGGIHDRSVNPKELILRSIQGSGWHVTTTRAAGTATHGKRQSDQFGNTKHAIEEVDVLARLD